MNDMTDKDEKFGKRARSLFDASVDGLDAATLSSLNRSRRRAIAELGRPGTAWMRWVPAAGMATAMLVAVMLIVPGPGQQEQALPTSVTDMEILLGDEEFEMLEELEFYTWMDLAEDNDDVT